MPPFPRPLPPIEILSVEIILFLVVAILSTIIYFKTKEIYALTKHTGILHFRNIFLFFGLAYIFRFLHILVLVASPPPSIWHATSLVLVGYLSTMAVLSLAMTVINRYTAFPGITLLLHVIAFVSSFVLFVTRSHNILIVLHAAILLLTLIIAIVKSSKIITSSKVTYFLLFVFWILNILAFTRHLIPLKLKIPLYLLSIIVFFYIYVRVRKRFTTT